MTLFPINIRFLTKYSKYILVLVTVAFVLSVVMSHCIFCKIIARTEPTELLYEDDAMVVFKDIKPAAEHHYLAVPKRHIKSAKELTSDDRELLEGMIKNGMAVLREKGADWVDVRSGFHWPPFHSVGHLHLHLISPASRMGFISEQIFRQNSFWFVSPEYVLKNLKPKL